MLGSNLSCLIFHIMKHLVCFVDTVHVMHVCFSGQVFVCFSLTSDNLNVAYKYFQFKIFDIH